MAIRIKLPGMEIETDSAVEAMEIYRELAKKHQVARDSDESDEGDDPDEDTSVRDVSLGTHSIALLKLLLDVSPGHGKSTASVIQTGARVLNCHHKLAKLAMQAIHQ